MKTENNYRLETYRTNVLRRAAATGEWTDDARAVARAMADESRATLEKLDADGNLYARDVIDAAGIALLSGTAATLAAEWDAMFERVTRKGCWEMARAIMHGAAMLKQESMSYGVLLA